MADVTVLQLPQLLSLQGTLASPGYRAFSSTSGTDAEYQGRFYGVVKRGTTLIAGAIVCVHHRDSAIILRSTLTAADGTFSFVDLELGGTYHIFAYDPNTGAPLNAARRAEVAPTASKNVKVQFLGVSGTGTPKVPVFLPAPHRYFYIDNIDVHPSGSHFEISEIRLFDETNTDITALFTISTTVAADVLGPYTNIFDNNLTTRAIWSVSAAESMRLKFDAGVGVTKRVMGVKQGGFDTNTRFMVGFRLNYSDDDVTRTPIQTLSGLTYPGNNTLSSLYTITYP